MSESGHTERLEAALDGKYRIERKLGEGGMASVYLAEDIKHKRPVALKILRPELAAVLGSERFLAEIQTTANLQHPHILPLFDSGEADGYLYYVMPYIDGETLREKLDREKQLGVEEAVRIARDVADALDYAHRAGVIHRDIKPGNILLHDARPVVADFGIALAVSAAGGGRMTETGLSLGTPHYMSPEQASADRDLSPKSDVYSLGCVLYEMLAGQPPHTGPSAQSILVHILTEEPKPLTALRHTVPPNVAATVAKAIEKLPADRFQSAKEFEDALGDGGFQYHPRPGTTAIASGSAASSTSARRQRWFQDPRSLIAAVGVALAAWGWLRPTSETTSGVVTRTQVNLPGSLSNLAISPEGDWIVARFGIPPSLHIRPSSDPEWRPLPNTDLGTDPSFSPDGQSVAFFADDGTLRKVPVFGGPAVRITNGGGGGLHWTSTDEIVFADAGALYRVGSSGGEPEVLLRSDTIMARHPFMLPGGEGVVFNTIGGGALSARVLLLEIESGEVREIAPSGANPKYLRTGHLVFGHGDQVLMGMGFDVETLRPYGSQVVLLPSLQVSDSYRAYYDVTEAGTLIYAASGDGELSSDSNIGLLWVDMDGVETPLDIEPTPLAPRNPRVAPDGVRIAYQADGHIWVHDTDSGTTTQMTFEGRNDSPVWSPDGRHLYFLSERSGTDGLDGFRRTADGSTSAEQLWTAEGEVGLTGISPDGRWLVVAQLVGASNLDRKLALVDLDADTLTLTDYGSSSLNEYEGRVSPNGRWMAYATFVAGFGNQAVFIRGFPEPTGGWRVSQANAAEPVWDPSGNALYFAAFGTDIMRAAVSPEGTSPLGRVESLGINWQYNPGTGANNVGFDVHPDGDRFLVVRSASSTDQVVLVTNWFTELRERMGEN